MIVERIGEVAYRLEFPSDLNRIHDVFHVSMLCNYIPDPSHVLTEQPVEIQEKLTYEEEPVQILDRLEQVLRTKTIPLVKVLWRSLWTLIFHVRPHSMARLAFCCVVGKPFKKTVWSCHLFLFYFKREKNKIRKKNPKYDS